jgi:hypothetical protein
MTNFYAVYLFLIIALIMLGIGLYFKHAWLFWLSALGWVMTAFYCFSVTSAAMPYVGYFGVFCLIATIAMILAPLAINRKAKALPPPEVSNSDQILANAERVRKLRGQHKMQNQKGLF